MINAREASEKLAAITPEKRVDILRNKVSRSTQRALEKSIHKTIAQCERRVDIVLSSRVCCDPDENIGALLEALGYTEIEVSSDFPGYCESYDGTTHISFSIPS